MGTESSYRPREKMFNELALLDRNRHNRDYMLFYFVESDERSLFYTNVEEK